MTTLTRQCGCCPDSAAVTRLGMFSSLSTAPHPTNVGGIQYPETLARPLVTLA